MANRPSTIGSNPLDFFVPVPPPGGPMGPGSPPVTPSPAPAAAPRAERAARPMTKERLTVHLPLDVIDRVKNAVYWTPGLTLASLAEEALRVAVDRLEAERGEPYQKRRSELKGGRPMK